MSLLPPGACPPARPPMLNSLHSPSCFCRKRHWKRGASPRYRQWRAAGGGSKVGQGRGTRALRLLLGLTALALSLHPSRLPPSCVHLSQRRALPFPACSVLGPVVVGHCTKVGAGSVVATDLPPHVVAGELLLLDVGVQVASCGAVHNVGQAHVPTRCFRLLPCVQWASRLASSSGWMSLTSRSRRWTRWVAGPCEVTKSEDTQHLIIRCDSTAATDSSEGALVGCQQGLPSWMRTRRAKCLKVSPSSTCPPCSRCPGSSWIMSSKEPTRRRQLRQAASQG